MKKLGISLAIAFLSFSLFCHMQKQTHLATLKMEVAGMHQTYLLLDEESKRLDYLVKAIHDPNSLIEMSKDPRFAHLNWANKSELVVKDNTSSPDFSGFAALYK